MENSEYGNKSFRRLPNISKSSITDRESKKDWAICRQYNLRSSIMQIYLLLKPTDYILTAHIKFSRAGFDRAARFPSGLIRLSGCVYACSSAVIPLNAEQR
ncbi:hypothetical protein C8R34_11149 [Nitrosomonas sp. Nm84]|nr:hypothetical protein C8R34_11149 [Nitrosomonas sp. Nm84]